MREIKFRAWEDKSKMNYSPRNTVIDADVNCEFYFAKTGQSDSVFMQFTGLKDKNGVDIYEGDVLNYGHKNNVAVIFENGCFSVFGEPLGWDFDSEEKPILIDKHSNHAIVVGNIHENPELL